VFVREYHSVRFVPRIRAYISVPILDEPFFPGTAPDPVTWALFFAVTAVPTLLLLQSYSLGLQLFFILSVIEETVFVSMWLELNQFPQKKSFPVPMRRSKENKFVKSPPCTVIF
jgi:hypothetical protein